MRWPKPCLALLLGCLTTGLPIGAQNPVSPTKAAGSPSGNATEAEVNELRKEVAAQKQTIEQLQTMVGRLAEVNAANGTNGAATMHLVTDSAAGVPTAGMVDAVMMQPDPDGSAVIVEAPQAGTPKASGGAALTAGWNGEHFFIRSPDGQFSINPYGYVDLDYRAYTGDAVPANTFILRRARFGFQGNYGNHFDFAILTDANSTSGAIVRDVYLNTRIIPEFQFQAGQFKEPFAQELATGATNLDFVERGLQALLYPSVVTAFRSPGITLHGDIKHGAFQYFAGAFNGRGGVTAAVVNEPEVVGRVRVYPWRNTNSKWLREFAFGGSAARAEARGLSGDVSFSATIPDQAYTFFPQLRINGPLTRYEAETTYIHGPLAFRGEYVQLQEQRDGVGSETLGGLAFFSYPGVGAKAWNLSSTYLLTGEKQPENGTPRVKHPLFGPDTPEGQGGRGWGAWGLGVRYSAIQAIAPGANDLNLYTPGFVSSYSYRTDQFTFGFNWYLNYWVKYQFNIDVDRLAQPSVTGQEPGNFVVFLQELQYRF
ncbi:MAG TPA: porin [Bryocella sp.]|nr:porin [Bryocella sp.]